LPNVRSVRMIGPMTVQLSVDGQVGEILLDRPDKRNALDDAMVAGLRGALDQAEQAGVRAVVLRGAGKGFCAGRDLAGANPAEEDAEAILVNTFNPLILRLARFPVPTFAAVHGAALGVGLGLALACDVVYVAEDAQVGSPFARIGAVLDSGGHSHFVHRLGPHRALELIYTARLLTGEEAAAWGLVNASLPTGQLLERVRDMAKTVASGPTQAFRLSKSLVQDIDTRGWGLEAVLGAEARAQGEACRTADYAEGIGAFQERRQPHFVGG
jgi:2-(1,2-epoxy-1,2-dihydrophenyl)acetyl-CoA isomerase